MGSLVLLVLYSCLLILPQTASAAAITCSNGLSGCHFQFNKVKDGTARNTPDGYVPGTHARHAGYSTSSTKREYKFACTVCHGMASGYNNAHQSGYKNISGSSLLGSTYSQGKRIPNTNNPSFGNCGNIYCHSTGRATGMGQKQYSSSKWGGTEGCRGCHAGRNGAAGAPIRSIGNFTLSTTHSQHLKYPAANINCQMCHSKTATDAATLKSYTAASRHVNGVRDVTFLASAGYGTYTSYKSSESGSSGNTKTCNNVSCHGGKSRSAWNATTTNNNHTCAHCHGIATTTVGTDLRAFAPGFRKQGTSTDQLVSSADIRVGSHFKHLSSVYMKNLKCNECHAVAPTNDPFAVSSHMGSQSRYNSQTLTFAQASTARWDGINNTTYTAFAGYTTGTVSKAATCSSVYCHGNRLKNNEVGGTKRKPYWNYSAMINYTAPATNVCASCHGYPPTANSHSSSTVCSDCHKNMSAADNKTFLDKSLHINKLVEVTSDCNGCHKYDTTGTNAWSSVTVGTDVAHYKHIAFIKTRLGYGALQTVSQTFAVGENLAVCGTCHTQTVALHNNGSKDITFGNSGAFPNTMGGGTGNSMSLMLMVGTNPSTPIFNTGTNVTCANLMCHYATTPNWYTSSP